MPNPWNDDVRNSIVTLVSGGQNSLDSGLTSIIAPVPIDIAQSSGLGVIIDKKSISGLNVVITASSPAWIQPSSGMAIALSGINVTVQSGVQITTSVVVASGTLVIGSVTIESGSYVILESGTPVHIDSGLAVVVTSGDGKAISMSGIILNTAFVSGIMVIVTSGDGKAISQSGLILNATNTTYLSGLAVIVTSGDGKAISMSGLILNIVTASGLPVVVTSGDGKAISLSGTRVILQSGIPVTITQFPMAAITGNVFTVGTSATQFPNVAGNKHIIRMKESGIVYIGGANTTVSGAGFWVGGDPSGVGAGLEIPGGNLNALYGAAVTSTTMTHISFI